MTVSCNGQDLYFFSLVSLRARRSWGSSCLSFANHHSHEDDVLPITGTIFITLISFKPNILPLHDVMLHNSINSNYVVKRGNPGDIGGNVW